MSAVISPGDAAEQVAEDVFGGEAAAPSPSPDVSPSPEPGEDALQSPSASPSAAPTALPVTGDYVSGNQAAGTVVDMSPVVQLLQEQQAADKEFHIALFLVLGLILGSIVIKGFFTGRD